MYFRRALKEATLETINSTSACVDSFIPPYKRALERIINKFNLLHKHIIIQLWGSVLNT
jgi:hypothetical protein